MPSHPDRVRRNYHTIKVSNYDDFLKYEEVITIKISKMKIASAMTRQEIWHNITRSIKNGILGFKLGHL